MRNWPGKSLDVRKWQIERLIRDQFMWSRLPINAGMQGLFSPGTLQLIGFLVLGAIIGVVGYRW